MEVNNKGFGQPIDTEKEGRRRSLWSLWAAIAVVLLSLILIAVVMLRQGSREGQVLKNQFSFIIGVAYLS